MKRNSNVKECEFYVTRGSILDFTLLAVVFSRFNIHGMRIGIFFYLAMCLYYIYKKGFNYKIIYVLILLFTFSLYSLLLRNEVDLPDLPFQESAIRPVLLFCQLSIELYFSFIILNMPQDKIINNKCKLLISDYIIITTGILYFLSQYLRIPDFFGVIHYNDDIEYFGFRGFGNEPGTWIFLLLIRTLLIPNIKTKKNITLILVFVVLMFFTKSSVIFTLPCILFWFLYHTGGFYRKILWILLFAISCLAFYFFGDALIHKLGELLNPSSFSGRYIANYIALNELIINPFIGYGLDSYDTVRRLSDLGLNSSLEIYDHGGSDLIILLLDFGVVIFLYLIYKVYNLFKISNALIIFFLILIPLSIKGQGIYSTGYLPLWCCFLIYSKYQSKNYVE